MTPDPFFGTSLRRDPAQSADLRTRIEAQLRERIEEAVDFVCLEALVRRRRRLGLAPPSADNSRDREEFTLSVLAFLAELYATIAATLSEEQRRKVATAERATGDETQRLLGVHVVLARELPDYWQRFETARPRDTARNAGSSGKRRGLLDRLFGRG